MTVAAGDNLWEIAARVVANARGLPRAALSDADVSAYWAALCDANRATLASGDVNVVYPGESLVLPPVS